MTDTPSNVVLVTGGSGLIGRAVCRRLAAAGYSVVSLDLKPGGDRLEGVGFVPLDLSKRKSIRRALSRVKSRHGRRISSVIHLAAYYSFAEEDSPQYDRITVQGTERLLDELEAFDVEQFVFSSTMLVHAPTEPGRKISEKSPLEPKWAYPLSKVKAERVIREHRGGIPHVVLRIAGVYDDLCHSIPIAHQIERIFERHLTSHLYPADPNLGQAFLHLEDLVNAIEKTVERRKELPAEQVILLGEPETLTYAELQDELGTLIHGEEWATIRIPKPAAKAGAWAQEKAPLTPAAEPFIKPWMVDLADDHYELDIAEARRLLGWEPRHRLRETLPLMIHALKWDPEKFYRENKLSKPVPLAIAARRILPYLAGAAVFALLRRRVGRLRTSHRERRRARAA